ATPASDAPAEGHNCPRRRITTENALEITENDLLLVTGATGLVGSHIAEAARQRGIRTRALVRSPEKAQLLNEWGVELVPGDMTDAASLQRAAQGATIV